MNILHMKYAVEIANAGAINKAAESLFIAPSNLSRSIKELEADLGVTLFDRSSKGVSLTLEGENFIRYAKKILNEIGGLEKMFRANLPVKQKFSISVPRASYISDAFVRFSKSIEDEPAEIYYQETNPWQATQNILTAGYNLGIIRYAAQYDRYFRAMLQEKGLSYKVIAEFRYVLIMSRESVLTTLREIRFSDLRPLIEIAHADPFVPSLPLAVIKKEELPDDIERRIFVFERGSQFDLLSENPKTFMWVSPVPDQLLHRYDLIQRECMDNQRFYRDVLIHRSDYALSALDKKFITEVRNSKRRFL